MKIAIQLLAMMMLAAAAYSQPCLNAAREVAPVLSPETRALYEQKLTDAEAVHLEKPNEADSIIWLGRRMAYLGRYKDAVRVFSSGMVIYKADARFYRHRGHRYLTLRCFDDAIRDLETADRLMVGKPDEIEPDGIPNAKNIPTSTLKSNISYHLGLAYYLKGNWGMAASHFMNSYNAAYTAKSADMKVASAHWVYMSAAREGPSLRRDADRLLKREIKDNEEIIENQDYFEMIKLYKGQVKVEDLLKAVERKSGTVSAASLGYGIGNYFLYNGDKEKAMTIFRKIVSGNQWASFGYIASEQDIQRMRVTP
jgi:tetratricopeptide (TPR) repeat protein